MVSLRDNSAHTSFLKRGQPRTDSDGDAAPRDNTDQRDMLNKPGVHDVSRRPMTRSIRIRSIRMFVFLMFYCLIHRYP